jgi:hypothetical protein
MSDAVSIQGTRFRAILSFHFSDASVRSLCMKIKLLRIVLIVAILVITGIWIFRSPELPEPPAEVVIPKPKKVKQVEALPQVPAPVLPKDTVFSLFGPSNSFQMSNGWSAGVNGHAESFVPNASGRLHSIALAIEPSYVRKGMEKTAPDATIILAEDANGLPGNPIETFTLHAISPKVPQPDFPQLVESTQHPVLQAGMKYWVCVRSSGRWLWRNNNLNKTEVSARESEPGKWASAGNGRNGAFSVSLESEK